MNYSKLLKVWNPWWIAPDEITKKANIVRDSDLEEIFKYLNTKEIQLIKGIRRIGKSTIVYQIIYKLIFEKNISPKNIFYFNFDQPLDKSDNSVIQALMDSYLENNAPHGKIYVFFDEIQNISNWEQWIKKEYDLKGKDIKFIITGSNNYLLSTNLSKQLTGRTITHTIHPLSFSQFLYFTKFKYKDTDLDEANIKNQLLTYLLKGGFPEVVLEKDKDINKKRLLEYFDGIIIRDIISLKQIKDTKKLKELAYYLITNICVPVSYSKLGINVGLNKNTVKEYISNLEEAFLIYELNFYSYSVKQSINIQQPKKIYCVDNGLREAIAFKFWDDYSKLVENLVFIELLRREKEIYYWKDQNEIDFVIQNKEGTVDLINVCFDNEIPEREIQGFLQFRKTHKNIRKQIIITKDLEKKEKSIYFIPLHKWLLTK